MMCDGKGQYWAWQPDFEDNHLESLSCHVLIPAEWLRNLLEEKETQLSESQARETGLREALRKLQEIWWSDKTDNDKEVADYEQMIDIIDEALSTPATWYKYRR